jgi:glycerol-3-phosphate dehydrogenase (NAD(P)+)
MKITIVGDGGWGTALALLLHRGGHSVGVWGPFPDYVRHVLDTRENDKFLPGVALPESIEWTSDPTGAAAGAEAVVLAVPSRFYRGVLETFAPLVHAGVRVLSVSKGFDQKTRRRLSQVAAEILGRPVAALSGPSHAEEVARGIPTAVTIAAAEHAEAVALQQIFNGPDFRVYTSDDMVGVEAGGALKNVIAIAAGVCDGIGFGDNTKAALVTRGLAEMTRLGVALGAHAATFSGLSGIGDLIVTCMSRLSRNRYVGECIGKGEKPEALLQRMEQVAEGVWTCSAALDLARQHRIEVPITEQVCGLVHEGRDPRHAVQALMSRDPKAERG